MSEPSNPSGDADTLLIGVLSPIQHLDPLAAQDFNSAVVVSQIFETPYARPEKGLETEPLLLGEPLRTGSDPLELSAPVRPGVRFSDGTPLDAGLLAGSLRRAAPLREQAHVDSRDDRVVFRLKRPNARFDLVLSQTYCAVTLERGGNLLGTGPYMPASDASPAEMRLLANPHAHRPPGIAEIVFRCYPPDEEGRPAALVAALEAGEVDFTNVLHRDAVAGVQKVRKHFELGNSTALLYFNTERPAMRDPRVRRAICLAIDRLELAQLSHSHALAYSASCLLPPMMSSWRDGALHDLNKALELAREVGSELPGRLLLRVMFGPRPYLPHPRETADYIRGRLSKLGMEVVVEQTVDSHDYYARVTEGDYDMFLSGWLADTPDPADFLEATLASHAIPSPDTPISIHANLGRWRSPEANAAIESLRREPDEAAQNRLLHRVSEELPLFPLMYGAIVFVHSWQVRGFAPPPLGVPDFSRLTLRPSFG